MHNGRTVLAIGSSARLSSIRLGKLSTMIEPKVFALSLYGAEDPPNVPTPPTPPPAPTDPPTPSPTPPPTPPTDPPTNSPTDPPGTDPNEPDMFPRDYVEKLRQEAKENRIKADELEKEKTARERAEMDELTRAQAERDEEKAKREAAETALAQTRLELSVTAAATAANFHDPQDALALIPQNSIALDSDGTPNKQSVEAAIKRLADSKPHLVRGRIPGSGDGGARGLGPATLEDRKAEHGERFKQLGGVPKPTKPAKR